MSWIKMKIESSMYVSPTRSFGAERIDTRWTDPLHHSRKDSGLLRRWRRPPESTRNFPALNRGRSTTRLWTIPNAHYDEIVWQRVMGFFLCLRNAFSDLVRLHFGERAIIAIFCDIFFLTIVRSWGKNRNSLFASEIASGQIDPVWKLMGSRQVAGLISFCIKSPFFATFFFQPSCVETSGQMDPEWKLSGSERNVRIRYAIIFFVSFGIRKFLPQGWYGRGSGGRKAFGVRHDTRHPDDGRVSPFSSHDAPQHQFRRETGRLVQRQSSSGCSNDGSSIGEDLDTRCSVRCSCKLARRSWPPGARSPGPRTSRTESRLDGNLCTTSGSSHHDTQPNRFKCSP